MQVSTHTQHGIDKVTRYGWKTTDKPGDMKMLHKDVLQIHPAYQREVLPNKVKEITAAWSWLSLGALVIGERGGEYWVIDGQHRAIAAKRRSDITLLPCIVFQTSDVKAEAQGFLDLNTGRKPVTAIAKQKAKVAAGDETAAYVQHLCDVLELQIKASAKSAGQIKCISWCTNRCEEDKDTFTKVLTLGAELSKTDGVPIAERLLDGLWLLNRRAGEGLNDKRLVNRIREKGARKLIEAANRAASAYAGGGARIWAQGMIEEINKGLQRKFSMDGADA